MKHDGKLDNIPFRETLFIEKKVPREQLLQNNNKILSQPKDFNRNTDTYNTYPTQAIIAHY